LGIASMAMARRRWRIRILSSNWVRTGDFWDYFFKNLEAGNAGLRPKDEGIESRLCAEQSSAEYTLVRNLNLGFERRGFNTK
jgi:hypothetical protein